MPPGEYGGGEWGDFEYGGTVLVLAASTAETTSTAQSATLTPQTTTLIATTATSTSTGQSATTAPQSVSLPAEVATASVTANPTVLAPQTATLAASVTETDANAQSASIGYLQWVVSNTPLRVQSVTLRPTELDLDIRARTTEERNILDTLDSNAGAVDTRERADGTTEGLDLAGGNNTYTFTPPITLNPPRIERDWLVEDVSRTRTSSDTEAIEATVSLVASQTRSSVTGYSDSTNTDLWEFDFNGGLVVTARVGEPNQGATTTLPLVLSPAQAELIETLTAATAGAVTSVVPDGETFSRDTTPNNRQTVTITPPQNVTTTPISQGDYVVTDWESRGSAGGAFRLDLEVSTRY